MTKKRKQQRQQAQDANRMFAIVTVIAVILIAIAGIALLSGGDGEPTETGYLPDPGLISPTRYQELFVDKDVEHYLLDVRTVEEFNAGHIVDAENRSHELVLMDPSIIPTDIPVVLYCRTGNRSGQVTAYLVSLGYDNIYDIDGGTVAWTDAELPLQQ